MAEKNSTILQTLSTNTSVRKQLSCMTLGGTEQDHDNEWENIFGLDVATDFGAVAMKFLGSPFCISCASDQDSVERGSLDK